jgi:hypothetical protein
VISSLTSFIKSVGDAISALKNFNALPPPTSAGYYENAPGPHGSSVRRFVPNPNAPPAGHYEEAAGPHGRRVQRWVANPDTVGSGLWGAMSTAPAPAIWAI